MFFFASPNNTKSIRVQVSFSLGYFFAGKDHFIEVGTKINKIISHLTSRKNVIQMKTWFFFFKSKFTFLWNLLTQSKMWCVAELQVLLNVDKKSCYVSVSFKRVLEIFTSCNEDPWNLCWYMGDLHHLNLTVRRQVVLYHINLFDNCTLISYFRNY